MKDIAEYSGLSRQTVGFALGARAHLLKEETRMKAENAAAELGYRKISSAVSMKTGKTNCVALLLGAKHSSSLFSQGMMKGIQESLHANNMHMMVEMLEDAKLTNEEFFPRILQEVMSDGLLINYNYDIPEKMVELIEKFNLPAVWLNSKHDFNAVYPDEFNAAVSATEKLLKLNHEKIVYLDFTHNPDDSPRHYSGIDRLAGYEKAMKSAGLTPRRWGSKDEMIASKSVSSIMELLKSDQKPTAVVTYCDREYQALIMAAGILGIAIPKDLSFIIFENRVHQIYGLEPATMLIPEGEMGIEGTQMLCDIIDNQAERRVPAKAINFQLNKGDTLNSPYGGTK